MQEGAEFEQPTDLEGRPELLSLHRKLIAVGLAALIASTCLITFLRWQALKYIQSDEHERLRQTAELAARSALDRLARYSQLAQILASSAQFTAPADSAMDSARFERLGHRDAQRLAGQNRVVSWLQTEGGPALSSELYKYASAGPLSVWQITRGLPLESTRGKPLAESRRQLAAESIAADRGILNIAELDPDGRIIFLAPYESQLRLRYFSAAPALLAPPERVNKGERQIRAHSTLLEGNAPDAVSFIAPIERNSGVYSLVVTVATDMGTGTGARCTFGLFDGSGHPLMHAGDLNALTEGARADNSRILVLPLPSTVYTLRMLVPHSSASAVLWGVVLLALGLQALVTLFFSTIMRRALLWVCRLQWKLDNIQKQVQSRVQNLAHDFQNRIFALRTIMGNISGRLTLDQLQRLGGAIDDVGGYTDQLSTTLVPDAFALMDVPGSLSELNRDVSSYLRGVLEVVVQQQEGILKHAIPVRFEKGNGKEIFVAISRTALTRIVSNLLVNALEACTAAGTHDVSVDCIADGDYVHVRVTDDGCGIEPAFQERIFDLAYSTKGESRGKGLANCLDLARRWSANVALVSSRPLEGTVIELIARRVATPPWFVNRILLSDGMVIVVVDDEGEVFSYWEKTIAKRLEGINLNSGDQPRLIGLRGPDELRRDRRALATGTLFLVDYKFKEEATNGIELVEELNLCDKAILVTNHFEQPDVLEGISRLGLRLLPKTYMLNAKFPIEFGGA